MKKIFAISLLAATTVLCVSGCATYVAPTVTPGICSVHDKAGRNWSAQGHRACHKARRKCHRWHKKRGMKNWACMNY